MNHHIPIDPNDDLCRFVFFTCEQKINEFIHFSLTRNKHSIRTILNDAELTFDGLDERVEEIRSAVASNGNGTSHRFGIAWIWNGNEKPKHQVHPLPDVGNWTPFRSKILDNPINSSNCYKSVNCSERFSALKRKDLHDSNRSQSVLVHNSKDFFLSFSINSTSL